MPNRNNNRMGRIDEEYRKELSQIISYDLKNPNVTGMISVTKVKVTTDLKYAKIYVSILNSKNIKETMDGLKKSSCSVLSAMCCATTCRSATPTPTTARCTPSASR